MSLTPKQQLDYISAELKRCDEYLTTLWHEDSRREVKGRRKAVLDLGHKIAADSSISFEWPDEPCHPRLAKL